MTNRDEEAKMLGPVMSRAFLPSHSSRVFNSRAFLIRTSFLPRLEEAAGYERPIQQSKSHMERTTVREARYRSETEEFFFFFCRTTQHVASDLGGREEKKDRRAATTLEVYALRPFR